MMILGDLYTEYVVKNGDIPDGSDNQIVDGNYDINLLYDSSGKNVVRFYIYVLDIANKNRSIKLEPDSIKTILKCSGVFSYVLCFNIWIMAFCIKQYINIFQELYEEYQDVTMVDTQIQRVLIDHRYGSKRFFDMIARYKGDTSEIVDKLSRLSGLFKHHISKYPMLVSLPNTPGIISYLFHINENNLWIDDSSVVEY